MSFDAKYQLVSFPLDGGDGWERSSSLRIVHYKNSQAYAHGDPDFHGRKKSEIIDKLNLAIKHIESMPIIEVERIG